jgi:hypothetical protein
MTFLRPGNPIEEGHLIASFDFEVGSIGYLADRWQDRTGGLL